MSDVNDNAEDFPKVAVDAYLKVVIVFKFVSTFVNCGYQSLVPNIGEDARAEMMLKSLSIANWNLWSVCFIISCRIPSTSQAFFWVEGFVFCPVVIREFSGFW